jgi:hypothetical protein
VEDSQPSSLQRGGAGHRPRPASIEIAPDSRAVVDRLRHGFVSTGAPCAKSSQHDGRRQSVKLRCACAQRLGTSTSAIGPGETIEAVDRHQPDDTRAADRQREQQAPERMPDCDETALPRRKVVHDCPRNILDPTRSSRTRFERGAQRCPRSTRRIPSRAGSSSFICGDPRRSRRRRSRSTSSLPLCVGMQRESQPAGAGRYGRRADRGWRARHRHPSPHFGQRKRSPRHRRRSPARSACCSSPVSITPPAFRNRRAQPASPMHRLAGARSLSIVGHEIERGVDRAEHRRWRCGREDEPSAGIDQIVDQQSRARDIGAEAAECLAERAHRQDRLPGNPPESPRPCGTEHAGGMRFVEIDEGVIAARQAPRVLAISTRSPSMLNTLSVTISFAIRASSHVRRARLRDGRDRCAEADLAVPRSALHGQARVHQPVGEQQGCPGAALAASAASTAALALPAATETASAASQRLNAAIRASSARCASERARHQPRRAGCRRRRGDAKCCRALDQQRVPLPGRDSRCSKNRSALRPCA